MHQSSQFAGLLPVPACCKAQPLVELGGSTCSTMQKCCDRYQVRLDAARTRDTQLLFVTTGILLRYMAGDALLSAFSHVIVDEAGSPSTDPLLISADTDLPHLASDLPADDHAPLAAHAP